MDIKVHANTRYRPASGGELFWLMLDGSLIGELELGRKPVYDRPFMVLGSAPVKWVVDFMFTYRTSMLTGKVSDDTRDGAIGKAVEGARAFVTSVDGRAA